MSNKILDNILIKLLNLRGKEFGASSELIEDEIIFLCKLIRPILLNQPTLLELKPPITIVGDIHGQYHDLLRIFEISSYPPLTNYLFLGDYVDRGKKGIETVCLLFLFKIKYPNNFFLLRGNHENSSMNRFYGFYDECIKNFSIRIWKCISDIFNCLPLVALIDDKIFCCHGGIPKDLNSLEQIKKIERPIDIPENGLICELVWSDPNSESENFEKSNRNAGLNFGLNQVNDFLNKFNLELIVRAHQAINEGFEFPFKLNQKDFNGFLTVFSAPNYCYEFGNKGAILHIDESLLCSFSVLEPVKWEEDYFVGPRPGTPPK